MMAETTTDVFVFYIYIELLTDAHHQAFQAILYIYRLRVPAHF